jgi:hypothetical protein
MKKLVITLVVAAIISAAWYAFRPERLFINQRVNEQSPMVATSATTLAKGQFHSGAHETKGTATILQSSSGQRTLRLTGFETSNGPDVHVYLVAAPDAKDADTVKNAGYVDLGSMKGNIGDQNYDVPSNLDLGKYRAATIWCARFSVNFGTAPLMNDSMQSMTR